jgi:4'-phosphopantetheinyl transferase
MIDAHSVRLLERAPGAAAQQTSDAHVWVIRLDASDDDHRVIRRWLSEDELSRAATFVFEQHRRRFVVCRGALRAILAGYLRVPPKDVTFRYGRQGKPYLDGARHGTGLSFNTSHSDDLALIAVGHDREVGVDLEHVRPMDGIDDIVARDFARNERLAFWRAAPASQLATFYRVWTLKEAWLKASGVGMNRRLSELDVTVLCVHPTRLPEAAAAPDDRWWSARMMQPVPDYVAAIVAEEGDASLLTLGVMEWSHLAGTPLTVADVAHRVVPTTTADRDRRVEQTE